MENGPFVADSPIQIVIFHSYVKLPEGMKQMSVNDELGSDGLRYMDADMRPG